MATNVRLSTDGDLLQYESKLDDYIPREQEDQNGHITMLNDWDRIGHMNAAEEIERRLSARRAIHPRVEIGRLSIRSKEDFRTCASWFAIHFLYNDADNRGDPSGFFYRKSRYYLDRAGAEFDRVAVMVDYDRDSSDTIDSGEENQPFPAVFLRG